MSAGPAATLPVPVAHAPERSRARTMREFGPVIVARQVSPWSVRRRAGPNRGDALALCLPGRATTWRMAERELPCPAGGGVLIDLSQAADTASVDDPGLVLLLPRRLLPLLGSGRIVADRVPASAALAALGRLAEALLRDDAAPTEAQARLAGRALGELLAAALLPLARAGNGLSPRREGALLDRLIAHVDAHLATDLDAATLCATLNCSRSALYRATSGVGGVAALVAQRRLAAVHDRLSDPAERRSIAALARASGLSEPAQFSRSFKRHYGVTAAAWRRAAQADHPVDAR